jgi:hypothetical protein
MTHTETLPFTSKSWQLSLLNFYALTPKDPVSFKRIMEKKVKWKNHGF